MAKASSEGVNIPQLAVLFIIAALAVRWLFFSPSPSAAPGASSSSQNARSRGAINPATVDQISQMFPQLDRREIMWDLQRNGGNRQRTVERVLMGRGLETPPVSFQPAVPTPSPATSARSTGAATGQNRSAHPDLISRYNLQSKIAVSAPAMPESTDATPQKQGWSANKVERQSLLQSRREQMILEARRKMQEKEKASQA